MEAKELNVMVRSCHFLLNEGIALGEDLPKCGYFVPLPELLSTTKKNIDALFRRNEVLFI